MVVMTDERPVVRSYLVIASTADDPEFRFEYESIERLGAGSVFRSDDGESVYKVWRVFADDSGRYDGLVDADELRHLTGERLRTRKDLQ